MSSITEEKYRKLKREVEEAKEEASRAQGALDGLLGRLKAEFKCSSFKEAKALLKTYEKEENNAEAKFAEALKNYEREWKRD